MKNKGRIQFFLLSSMMVSVVSSMVAHAQVQTPKRPQPRAELALKYSYVHSNMLPTGCGCFNLNGGGGAFAWRLAPAGFDLVGDISITHGSAAANSYDLTLSTFTFGGRYAPQLSKWPVRPFGQVLLGLAHSSGSLVAPGSPATNAGAAFATNIGGGLDIHVNRRFSVRAIEVGYLLTTFNNGVNDHQNNLRLDTGIVFHF